ncbi:MULTISPECIES: fatty acid desaturase family protein [unclassified Streptomyces]|uniref:fatty acid desaturase family protein n=1 Tax=unclassified Streptomyces TaxID=2593676 RepID=UPI00093BEF5B|nr:fatty acid desaturase [Streptomyces sp. CB02058]
MAVDPDATASHLLFRRDKVAPQDQFNFILKLIVALILGAAAVLLILFTGWPGQTVGIILLAAVYVHMVELQHQCLHHSAFRSARPHRPVGFLLGLPMLVSYSHYRVLHLQHHRFLGTAQDTEFFGFDTRQPLTWGVLFRESFNYGRLLSPLATIGRCWAGRWEYTAGQISRRRRADVINEYRALAVPVVAALAVTIMGHGELVLKLWLLPLVIAVPMHFWLELPEHILCDNDSTDVLRNTRTITGSWLSRWFTNGNNLHVEHHAAMMVPINRLPERHAVARELALHVERSYPAFFLAVGREVRRNALKKRHERS